MSTMMRNTLVRPSPDRLGAGRSDQPPPGPGPGLKRLRHRVSLWPLALGLLLIMVSVVGITGLLAQRGAVTTIWVAASDIDSDASLQADDLVTVTVAGAVEFEHYSASAVPREALLAAVPRVDIPAGTPLAAGQFYDGSAPAPLDAGSLTVAVVLGPAHVPANLGRGDRVLLVGVPDSARPEAVAQGWPGTVPVQQEATVVSVSDSATTSEVTVTVAVPRDVVDDIAWLAGQKRLVIARDR